MMFFYLLNKAHFNSYLFGCNQKTMCALGRESTATKATVLKCLSEVNSMNILGYSTGQGGACINATVLKGKKFSCDYSEW